MRPLAALRAACVALAVLLVAIAIASVLAGGDDGVAWGFFLTGVALWGAGGVARAAARPRRRAA